MVSFHRFSRVNPPVHWTSETQDPFLAESGARSEVLFSSVACILGWGTSDGTENPLTRLGAAGVRRAPGVGELQTRSVGLAPPDSQCNRPLAARLEPRPSVRLFRFLRAESKLVSEVWNDVWTLP